MFRRFRAVALRLGVVVRVSWCGTSVAEANVQALGARAARQGDRRVVDYCHGLPTVGGPRSRYGERVGDVAYVQVDVTNDRAGHGPTPRAPAGFLHLLGGQPDLDPRPKCAGHRPKRSTVGIHGWNGRALYTGRRSVGAAALTSCDGRSTAPPPTRFRHTSIHLPRSSRATTASGSSAPIPFDIPDPTPAHGGPLAGHDLLRHPLSFAHRCRRQQRHPLLRV